MAKKTTKRKIVPNKKAKILRDQLGDEHLVVLEEKVYYSFTNLRPGLMFFPREDGSTDWFEGHETKTNITEQEREILLKSKDFMNGWIVEDKNIESEEELYNKNAMNDSTMKRIIEKYKDNPDDLEKIIDAMTSEFAVKRFKDSLIEADYPSSLIIYCDHKIKKIEEEYLESKKSPVDKEI